MGEKCVQVGANSNGGSDRVEFFEYRYRCFRLKAVVKLSCWHPMRIPGRETQKFDHSFVKKKKKHPKTKIKQKI